MNRATGVLVPIGRGVWQVLVVLHQFPRGDRKSLIPHTLLARLVACCADEGLPAETRFRAEPGDVHTTTAVVFALEAPAPAVGKAMASALGIPQADVGLRTFDRPVDLAEAMQGFDEEDLL